MFSEGNYQSLLKEILTYYRARFVTPLLTAILDCHQEEKSELAAIQQRLAQLEEKVEQLPSLILLALRDALQEIEQNAGGD